MLLNLKTILIFLRMINNNKNVRSKNNNNTNSNVNLDSKNIKSVNTNENIASENNTNSNVNITNEIDETANICHKCNKSFSSQQSLKLHLNTTDCIKKDVVNVDKLCEFCMKTFSSKQMLKYHLMVCSEKKIFNIIAEYESRIRDLEQEIEILKMK